MSNLTTRLLDSADDDPHETRRQAAARIEALEAELRMVTTQRDAFFQTVADRDAVLAETRGILHSSSVPLGANALWQQGQIIQEALNALSRVPQGAAEPTLDTSSATVDGYGNYYCPACKTWMPLEGNWGAVALQEHVGEIHG